MIILDILFASAIIICVDIFSTGYLLKLSNYFPESLISKIGGSISIIAGSIYLFIRYQLDFSHFGFDKTNAKKIVSWGTISGLTLGLISFPYSIISGENKIPKEHFVDPHQGIHLVFLFLVIVVVVSPFVEELFFRGFVYRIVKKKYDIFWGYVASAGLFWAAHDFYMPTILSALIYCYIYERTKLIGTSIIAHVIRNFIWCSAIYYSAYAFDS